METASRTLDPMKGKKKIFVVDDHPLFREGIVKFLEKESDLAVCGSAASYSELMEALKQGIQPDLITADISLPGGPNGVELIKALRSSHGGIPILIISMHDESLYSERVLRAGAKGYVMKGESPEGTLKAIRRVLTGQIYLSEAMTEKMLQKQLSGVPEYVSSVESLSDRELEVFELIGAGMATSKIAKNLHLSVKTIETYRANIKTKLNLSDNSELIKHAVQWVETQNHG